MSRCLLLNGNYEPLHVISSRRAILLALAGTVTIVADSEDIFHSASQEFVVPSVVALNRFIKLPRPRSITLSTRSVLARDGHRCAYCGEKADTIDHVIPRSKGGKHDWMNVVACCKLCNSAKGNKFLGEWTRKTSGGHREVVELLITPRKPTGALASLIACGGRIEDAWKPYLVAA